jgi:GTPase
MSMVIQSFLNLSSLITSFLFKAGKSTLLGVLTKNILDDGRGLARIALFKHKHEQESGRTSSVGMEVLGFQANGQQVTSSTLGKLKVTWEEVSAQASKIITFVGKWFEF